MVKRMSEHASIQATSSLPAWWWGWVNTPASRPGHHYLHGEEDEWARQHPGHVIPTCMVKRMSEHASIQATSSLRSTYTGIVLVDLWVLNIIECGPLSVQSVSLIRFPWFVRRDRYSLYYMSVQKRTVLMTLAVFSCIFFFLKCRFYKENIGL